MKVGDRITFTEDILDPCDGDIQEKQFAKKGDSGTVVEIVSSGEEFIVKANKKIFRVYSREIA